MSVPKESEFGEIDPQTNLTQKSITKNIKRIWSLVGMESFNSTVEASYFEPPYDSDLEKLITKKNMV